MKKIITIAILVITALAFYLAFSQPSAKNHLDQGFKLYQKARFKEAIVEFTKAADLKPAQYQAHYLLGRSYESLGNLDKALSEYLQAVKINQKNPEIHYNIAIIYRTKNSLSKALEQLKKAIALKTNFIGARLMYAKTLADLNQNKEAIKEYQSLIQGNYPNVDANLIRLELAKLYLKENDKTKAKKELEIVKRVYPDRPDVKELESKL